MKKFLPVLVLFSNLIFAQMPQFGEAKGLFLSAGVGPKIPIGSFADTNNPGSGFDLSLSYTDNLFFPLFINLTAGYTHFPGSQELYSTTGYSSFSSNVLTASLGARYYFSPLMNNIVLLMPVVDFSLLYANFNDFHQFKVETAKKSFNENYSKFGFQAGAGVSLFMFDIMAYYNYLQGHNYLSFDLRARIPVYVSM